MPGRGTGTLDAAEAGTDRWTRRLRAIGVLLDGWDGPVREVSVLEVEGGVVVQGLVPGGDGAAPVWRLTSREYSAAQLDEALATRQVRGGRTA